MVTRNSLFVDTSGWAYLVDAHASFHQQVRAVYQQAVNQGRYLVIMAKYGMNEALTTDHHFSQAGFIRLPH